MSWEIETHGKANTTGVLTLDRRGPNVFEVIVNDGIDVATVRLTRPELVELIAVSVRLVAGVDP